MREGIKFVQAERKEGGPELPVKAGRACALSQLMAVEHVVSELLRLQCVQSFTYSLAVAGQSRNVAQARIGNEWPSNQ